MFSTLFISSRTNLSSPGYESLQMKVTVNVSDVPVKNKNQKTLSAAGSLRNI